MQSDGTDIFIAALAPVGLIIGSIAAIVIVGLFIQSKIRNHKPNSPSLQKFTPTGLILAIIYTGIMITGMAIKQQFPNSELGSFLNSTYGFWIGAIVLMVSYAIFDITLQKLGLPSTEKKTDDVA